MAALAGTQPKWRVGGLAELQNEYVQKGWLACLDYSHPDTELDDTYVADGARRQLVGAGTVLIGGVETVHGIAP